MPKDKAKPKKDKTKKPKKPKKEAEAPAKPAAPAATPSFDAGRLFERYADPSESMGAAHISRDGFTRLVKELKLSTPASAPAAPQEPSPRTDFEAGRLFERFDAGRANGLSREQFADLLQQLQPQQHQSVQPAPPSMHPALVASLGELASAATAPWTATAAQQPPLSSPAPPPPQQQQQHQQAAAFSAGRMFERYDTNHSGALELEELRRLVADVRAGKVDIASLTSARATPPSLGPFSIHQHSHTASASAPRPQTGPPSAFDHRVPGSLPAASTDWRAAFGSGDLLYGGRQRAPPPPPSHTTAQAAQVPPSTTHHDPALHNDSQHLAHALTAPSSLRQAYHARLASLSAVHARLMARREEAAHHLARLGARREEVAAARRAVERETLADTEAVLHRLRSAESLKHSLLAHEASTALADVQAIDAFSQRLVALVPQPQADIDIGEARAQPVVLGTPSVEPAAALAFMRAYPELCADADRLLSRPPPPKTISVAADDFERETATRAAVVRRHRALLDLLAAKDAIIHLLLREREAAASARGRADRASAGELRRWVGLAERLAEELQTAREGVSGVGTAAEAARVVDVQARALADATSRAQSAAGASSLGSGRGTERRERQWGRRGLVEEADSDSDHHAAAPQATAAEQAKQTDLQGRAPATALQARGPEDNDDAPLDEGEDDEASQTVPALGATGNPQGVVSGAE